ncbi:hypothetical protein FDECE_17537 [Fusarium decemcellulare]|nr:hypothetical protein FDECE_17537 [Fusarium decemcellulare]
MSHSLTFTTRKVKFAGHGEMSDVELCFVGDAHTNRWEVVSLRFRVYFKRNTSFACGGSGKGSVISSDKFEESDLNFFISVNVLNYFTYINDALVYQALS